MKELRAERNFILLVYSRASYLIERGRCSSKVSDTCVTMRIFCDCHEGRMTRLRIKLPQRLDALFATRVASRWY